MNILGISAFYHDSAACLVRDGEIIAAAQEERFSRKKHDDRFPRHAIDYCLREAGLASSSELDLVAFYEKPFVKCDRLFSTYLGVAPRGLQSFLKAVPVWIKQKIWIKQILRDELKFEGTILFPEHHESHAASAFFPSPFEDAAVLTVDGVGEWATTTIGRGAGNRVDLLRELHFPHSLGLLYSAFTYYLGFRVNSGEYKVMGLAPYGQPRFTDLILSNLVDLKPDGSLRLNLDHFDFMAGLTMTSRSFAQLFGAPRRAPEAELTQHHMDVARSLQAVTEEVMLRMARHAHEVTGSSNLCLAGGVALNCVGNGRILREGPFEKIWIQPAAGDAGGALGAALLGWHHYHDQPREAPGTHDAQKASLLGPAFDPAELVARKEIAHEQLGDDELMERVAALLEDRQVIGWYQGRVEFGPRALGNRSILADPRVPDMQRRLNEKIKFRESFRPFAPAVLRERVAEYFELDEPSPYMLLVAPVKAAVESSVDDSAGFGDRLRAVRSPIPAVTHVDQSARIQTVDVRENPRFHALLRAFEQRTGCGVLINTSFNVRGEPPVCAVEDAYRCFMRTGMDYLVLGNLLIDKRQQQPLPAAPPPTARSWIADDYERIDRSPRALRRFGFTMGIVAGVITALLIRRYPAVAMTTGVVAVLFAAAGQFAPTSLAAIHRIWMQISLAMGWVMTRVILTLVFFLVLTPVGLLQRLAGKRAFEVAFRTPENTYWKGRETPFERESYERQY
ncbi:MAG: Nodulation protein nolO [uncultured Chthoniobacterales bacterium]|uniref:Nodulation protein nolO n=1 Tax=uncultured Chthoniobacterales bacterium TaxID=1836801 RepID=A0A6J4H1A3_9BACT|nr:MAG: Nodulation protein nolO [uncultured Chthoniobacterales bacterium]